MTEKAFHDSNGRIIYREIKPILKKKELLSKELDKEKLIAFGILAGIAHVQNGYGQKEFSGHIYLDSKMYDYINSLLKKEDSPLSSQD